LVYLLGDLFEMDEHFAIEKFCSQEEVESILVYYDSLDEADEYSNQRAKRKNMDYHNPDIKLVKEIVEPKLQKYFTNSHVSAGTFTNWLEHVELHTDSWQPDEDQSKKLGYSVLVPLRIVPENIETSTIIFNQWCKEEKSVSFESYKDDAKWNIAEYVHDDHSMYEILGKTEDKLDKNFHSKYLNHIDYKIIKNFANPSRYVWKVGDAIVWNRRYFHTSEAFNQLLVSKLHMIFFVNFDS